MLVVLALLLAEGGASAETATAATAAMVTATEGSAMLVVLALLLAEGGASAETVLVVTQHREVVCAFGYVLVLWNRTCPLARFLGVFVIAVKVLWYRICPLARFLGGFKADLLTWL